MRFGIIAAAAALAAAGPAAAQAPFVSRPIDPEKLVVGPANTAANVTGATAAGTIRTLGRTVAGVIEDNGFVRTVNNLLGRRAQPAAVQPGFSPLPTPGSFQSTRYQSAFTPVKPVASVFGKTPTVSLPVGPTTLR